MPRAPSSKANHRSSTRSTGRLVIAGTAAYLAVRSWNGPAYAVKGSWEAFPADLNGEPDVSLPATRFEREGLSLFVDEGRLNAKYEANFSKDKNFEFQIDDSKTWHAGLTSQDSSLRVTGEGSTRDTLDSFYWEASQKASADRLGEALFEFNSDKEYNLTISQPIMGKFLGADISGKVRFTKDGATGFLNGHAALVAGANLTYTVQNPVGVYDLAKSDHQGLLTVPVADGTAVLEVTHDGSELGYEASYGTGLAGGEAKVDFSYKQDSVSYNVSYLRSLEIPGGSLEIPGTGRRSIGSIQVGSFDAGVHLGVDHEGVYGRLVARKDLPRDLIANYEVNGRVAVGKDDSNPELGQSLRLSNKLGFAELHHANDGASPRVRFGYEFSA